MVVALRPALHEALLDAVGQEAITLDSHATGFTEAGDRVTLQLANGGVAEGDLLVGADGIGSVVRRVLHPDEAPPRASGIVAVRGAPLTVTVTCAARLQECSGAVAGATSTRSAVWPRCVCGIGCRSSHRLVQAGSEPSASKVVRPTKWSEPSVSTGITWAPASTRRRHTSTAL